MSSLVPSRIPNCIGGVDAPPSPLAWFGKINPHNGATLWQVARSTAPDVERAIAGMAMLRRAPRLAQVADTAAFLASDRAAGITGTIVNVTCGLLPG